MILLLHPLSSGLLSGLEEQSEISEFHEERYLDALK